MISKAATTIQLGGVTVSESYKIAEPFDTPKFFKTFATVAAAKVKSNITPEIVAKDIAILHTGYKTLFEQTVDQLEKGRLPVMTMPAALEYFDDCMVVIVGMLLAWGEDRVRLGITDDLSKIEFPEAPPCTVHGIDESDVDIDSAQVEALGNVKKEDLN